MRLDLSEDTAPANVAALSDAERRNVSKNLCFQVLYGKARSDNATAHEVLHAPNGGALQETGDHVHMVAQYKTWYNFGRIDFLVRMSPTMTSGPMECLWDVDGVAVEPSEYGDA
jgi:hypothetical protein